MNKEHLEYKEALVKIKTHYLLGSLSESISTEFLDEKGSQDITWNKKSMCFLSIRNDSEAHLYINKTKRMKKEEWEFIYATVYVLLALDLYKKLNNKTKELSAILFSMNYVENILGFKHIPEEWKFFDEIKKQLTFKNEFSIHEQLVALPELMKKCLLLNFMVSNEHISIRKNGPEKKYSLWGGAAQSTFSEIFADTLVSKAQETIRLKGQKNNLTKEELEEQKTKSYKAKKWFMNHFPLLSVLAARFKLVEDIQLCKQFGIQIGAVSAIDKTIYINPLAQLSDQGMKFVIAHEILHIALNHSSRCQGRDHLMWNLACDFVINHWLVEMGIGIPPEGIYLDKELAGKSADEIYLMIAQDVRLKKKMGTLKNIQAGEVKKNGDASCDMLDHDSKYFSEFSEACKEMLLRGVFLHETIGRGNLPANLVEEIKAINQPAIPWQVDLAKWIAEHFPTEERKRTYSRPSRRQSSTPDIPRPNYINPLEEKNTRTFGVVLDTSGSMDRNLLAKCLGAISSYSTAQDVKYIRLIFCDAQPFDEGYVSVDTLMNKINVKGRGGTVLQPAINLLENSKDFPNNAPILILSDGYVESSLTIKNPHAFLVPHKSALPFFPRGPVFEFKN